MNRFVLYLIRTISLLLCTSQLDAFTHIFINKTDKKVYAAVYFQQDIKIIDLDPHQYTSFTAYTKPRYIKFEDQPMTLLGKLYNTSVVWEIRERYNGNLYVLSTDKSSYERKRRRFKNDIPLWG